MDANSDETIFMGYALNSKAYKVFNKTLLIVKESIHVVFDETNATSRKGVVVDNDVDIKDSKIEKPKEKELESLLEITRLTKLLEIQFKE